MYTSLSIQDFRGIHTLEMNDFRRVNILTGKNNCGKTSVLEAMYLLSRSDNSGTIALLGIYRNIEVLDEDYWRSFFHNFGLQAAIVGLYKNEKREVTLQPYRTFGQFEDVLSSALSNPDSINGIAVRYDNRYDNKDSKFEFSMTRDEYDEPREVAVEEIDELRNAKNFPSVYSTLFINPTYLNDAPKRFSDLEIKKAEKRVVEALQRIEPSINYVKLIYKTFYCDIGKDRLIPLNVMGGGMVRLFSIILAIATTPGGVVLIDEIDTGFHYSSLEVMWKAVYEAAKQFDVQIFATTHSYECLRALDVVLQQRPGEDDSACLYRIDKRPDGHDAVRFDQQQFKVSLEHF